MQSPLVTVGRDEGRGGVCVCVCMEEEGIGRGRGALYGDEKVGIGGWGVRQISVDLWARQIQLCYNDSVVHRCKSNIEQPCNIQQHQLYNVRYINISSTMSDTAIRTAVPGAAILDSCAIYSNIRQLCQIQQYWTAVSDTTILDSYVRYSNVGQLCHIQQY